ncbi:leucine-rich repeat-containing protein 74B isoform X2 [Chionomys nivalis]|uniref:leucine-rich repeat-containing protein 74B isoform X2 n=1 Tax=Chionomys nivalis TaxID=269649 RepID=UPI0025940F47|nr:leucine-rich repeat-containing protein 74B isoform X2 [Chionomys nivalis]
MKGSYKESTKNEDQEGEAATTASQAEALEAKTFCTADSHFTLEAEGTHGLGEQVMATLYLESCQAHSVVPASRLLRQGSASELSLRHRGLGPQGVQALASTLTSNLYIKRLDLRDNGLCRAGAEALADVLCKNSIISGEILGPALAENTGLTELDLSWNHLRGPGAIAFAKGLEANIFLKVLDISHNGFGDSGASAIGEALKANNVLEELNMRNNRIAMAGALRLGLGLQVNQTLRILIISKNPIRSEGYVSLLKSIRNNRSSALELLDLSDIQVNRECDDLANSVNRILPGLCIKNNTSRRKDWPSASTPSQPASAPSASSLISSMPL